VNTLYSRPGENQYLRRSAELFMSLILVILSSQDRRTQEPRADYVASATALRHAIAKHKAPMR
jgi:hypothetical protein